MTRIISWLTLASFLCSGSTSLAADEGITVDGWGEASAMPTSAQLRVAIAGSAELGGDAIGKYFEFRRRTIEAINQIGHADLQFEHSGMLVGRPGDIDDVILGTDDSSDASDSTPRRWIAVSSVCRIKLPGISNQSREDVVATVVTLVDKLRDSGMIILADQNAESFDDILGHHRNDEPLLVSYVLDDAQDLVEAAEKRAFRSAEVAAVRLASLSGACLVGVTSMQRIGDEDDDESRSWQSVYSSDEKSIQDPLRLVSRTFSEIKVRVGLRIQFRTAADGEPVPAASSPEPATGSTDREGNVTAAEQPGHE